MLIGNIANLPKHSMFVLVAVASLDLHRVVAFLLFPLLVSLVIDHFVAILVRVEFVVFMILVMLLRLKERVDVSGYWSDDEMVTCFRLELASAMATQINRALIDMANRRERTHDFFTAGVILT